MKRDPRSTHQYKWQQVMRFISNSPNGKSFTEIQRFVVEDLHGLNYDDRDGSGKRRYRGYWCDYLYGTRFSPGFLKRFCFKHEGRWHAKSNLRHFYWSAP